MPLSAPPDRLIAPDGSVRLGKFDAPLPEVDLDRQRIYRLGALSRLRFKQWQHFAVIHPRWALTFAVVDVAFQKLAWVQVVDRETGRSFEHRREGPLQRLSVARSLWDERTCFESGDLAIDVHNHLHEGRHRVRLVARGDAPAVEASFDCLHDLAAIQPLVVSLPVGRGRAMYSHKVPLPVRGRLVVGDEEVVLDPAETTAVLDIHKAHYPRRTWWRWATFAGFDRQGRRLALNLTRNVVSDPAYNENAAWIDGRLVDLGEARFDLSGDSWSMGTADGAVDLTFQGAGERREDLDYGVIVSRFRQRFGTFRGTLRLAGEIYEVPDLFGLAEDHTSVW